MGFSITQKNYLILLHWGMNSWKTQISLQLKNFLSICEAFTPFVDKINCSKDPYDQWSALKLKVLNQTCHLQPVTDSDILWIKGTYI